MQGDPQSGLSNPTRRAFLRNTGSTAGNVVISGSGPADRNSTPGQSASPTEIADGPNIEGAVAITLRINGWRATLSATYVYFNNDTEGAAVKNAKILKRLVSGENA